MSTSILDLVNAKKKELQSKKASSVPTVKPPSGKSIWRILPGWRVDEEGNRDPKFFHDFGMHWIKTSIGQKKPDAVYICNSTTFQEPCEVCMALKQANEAATEEDQVNILKECRSQQKYLLNAIHVNGDKPNEVQILEVGSTIFEQICEIIGEWGDITDIAEGSEGKDIVISRSGSGFDTKYLVQPSPKSKKVDPSILNSLHNIDDVVSQKDPAKEKTAIMSLGRVVGIMPPTAVAATASLSHSLDDESAEDASFEDVSLDSEVAEEADNSDIDFDALLEGME